jgi:hypothetical protein
MRNSLRWSSILVAVAGVVAFTFTQDWRAEAAEGGATPVAFEICAADGPSAIEKCDVLGMPASFPVPSTRILVVEQVSGDCGSDATSGLPVRPGLLAQTGGIVVTHWIIGVVDPTRPGGLVPLTLTSLYADPGSFFTLNLERVPSGPSGRFCRLSVSGRLVKP